MPPLVYVPTITFILLICVLFLLLVYPGLHRYGSQVEIDSWPQGAAVYVDDTLIGSAPVRVFIPAGPHKIRLEKPHFESSSLDIDVKGRLFFSLFFPKKKTYDLQLQIKDLPTFLTEAYYQASAWFALTPDRVHPRAPVLKDTVQSLRIIWDNINEQTDLLSQWALSLRDLVQDKESWQQVDIAWRMLSEEGIELPARLTPLRKASSFEEFLQESMNIPPELPEVQHSSLLPTRVRMAGLDFVAVPGGKIQLGMPRQSDEFLPTRVIVPPFYYMPMYLSAQDYTRLTNIETGQEGSQPITRLTLAQAHLVVTAVNKYMEDFGMSSLAARLPNEAEWQYLAETQRIKPEFFEWTSDNYLRYRFIFYAGQAQFPQPFETREKVIRGESIFSGPMPIWYRFGFPQDYSSPYITFRLVLVKKS